MIRRLAHRLDPPTRPWLAYVVLPAIAWALVAGVGIGFVALVAHLVRPG